jgi:Spy/CpxP family protein refolding chaperone
MNKQEDNSLSSERIRHETRRPTRHGFYGGLFLGGLVGAILTISVGAFAQFDGHRSARFSGLDSEFAADRAEFAIGMVLGRVDATDAQQEQVTSIAQGAIIDLQSIMIDHRDTHEAVQEILAQPYVDRAALEQLRANTVLQADAVSQRLVRALGDAAEVLSVEQRVELMNLSQRLRH